MVDRLDQALAQPISLSCTLRAHLHHGELVAAEPGAGVRFANAGSDPLGHRDQQIVAREMAKRIVDVLEVVEIDQQQGHRLATSAGLGDSVLQAVVQQDPIGQTGQRVVVRHVVDLLLRPLALGDVVEHPDEAVGRALGPRHLRGGKQDRAPIAGAGAQPGLDAFAVHGCDAGRVRLLERGRKGGQHLADGMADQFRLRAAEQRSAGLVGIRDGAVRGGDQQTVLHAVEDAVDGVARHHGLAQVRPHGLERARELADLVRPVDRYPKLVVALTDPGGEARKRQDRPTEAARHDNGRDAGGDEDGRGNAGEPQIPFPFGRFVALGQVGGESQGVAIDPARGQPDRHDAQKLVTELNRGADFEATRGAVEAAARRCGTVVGRS